MSVFKKVLDGVNNTTGDSTAKRNEAAQRKIKGRDQAAQDRERRRIQHTAIQKKQARDKAIDWKTREETK